MRVDEAAHPAGERGVIRGDGEDEVDLVRVQHRPLGGGRHRRIEARGQVAAREPREHDREVIEQAVVERQQAGVGWQRALSADGGDDVAGRADHVVAREPVQLALELLDGPPLDLRITAPGEVAHVVVHDDRQRAHRVKTPRNAELQARLPAVPSNASNTEASRL